MIRPRPPSAADLYVSRHQEEIAFTPRSFKEVPVGEVLYLQESVGAHPFAKGQFQLDARKLLPTGYYEIIARGSSRVNVPGPNNHRVVSVLELTEVKRESRNTRFGFVDYDE